MARPFSRKFHALGETLKQYPQPPSNLTFSRKFYDLGNALGKGRSLTSVGTQEGSLAVTFAALDRVGASMVDQGYKQHAAQVLDQAKRNGASEADMAAEEKRMVQLRQDETLAAQKFNAGAKETYISQLDSSIQGIGKEMSARHPADTQAFAIDFTNSANELIKHLPDQWKPDVARSLEQYKNKLMVNISANAIKQQNDYHNATLFTAQNTAEADMMQAARDGNGDGVNIANAVYERKRGSRTDINAHQIVEDTLRVNNQLQRNIALGGLDRVINAGGDTEAYIEAFRADHKTITDPTQRDRVVAEMEGVLSEELRIARETDKNAINSVEVAVGDMLGKVDLSSTRSIFNAIGELDAVKSSIGRNGNNERMRASIGKIDAGLKKAQEMLKNVPQVVSNQHALKSIKDNPDLYMRALGGGADALTLKQLEAIKRFTIRSGAPQGQIDFLRSLAGIIIKRTGGVSGQKDNAVYVGIVDRIRSFGIKPAKGKITVDSATSATDLIKLQRDTIEAETLGQISHDEAQSFLTKIMPGLMQQVSKETGQSSFLGLGGGPNDVYDAGFQSITSLLEQNGEKDNVGLKAALFRTFVFRAEAMKIDEVQDPLERVKMQDALARQISVEFARKIAPGLSGLAPDSLPNGIFVNGKLFNVFQGISSLPTVGEAGGVETRRLLDGTIVQVIKGTNIVIRRGTKAVARHIDKHGGSS